MRATENKNSTHALQVSKCLTTWLFLMHCFYLFILPLLCRGVDASCSQTNSFCCCCCCCFFRVCCLCKTKWEIITWKILIRLLFLLSSCSIKKKSLKRLLLDFYRFFLKIQSQKLLKGLRKGIKRRESPIWSKYTWDRADSGRKKSKKLSICKEQWEITSEREHCICTGARGAEELNRKVPIATCRKILGWSSLHSSQWVRIRGDQVATWAATKYKEMDRTKNAKSKHLK